MVSVNIKYDQYDIRIDRKTKWGNPFYMKAEKDRDEVVENFKVYLWESIKSGKISLEELAELHDKKLGCHCSPKACHGDVLTSASEWAYNKLNT